MISSRRQFLVNGVRLTAAIPFMPGVSGVLGKSARAGGEPVLVVLQLSGGNDGLNTVVPHRQDEYYRMRPTLALARKNLHVVDDDHGLHPSLQSLGATFGDGDMAVLHGVGYPQPNRSHFRSMEIWHTADPEHDPDGVGWLGKLSDQIAREAPGSLPALHVGTGDLPLALYARDSFAPTVRDESGFTLKGSKAFARGRDSMLAARASGESGAANATKTWGDSQGAPDENELVGFLRSAAITSYRAATRMEEAASRESHAEYPGYGLAKRLRLIAQLVAGGFDTRIFHVELGGFDTHARQAPSHRDLLLELSQSMRAFQQDLEASGTADRVVTLVFSEFGRRAAENGSRGTDHGAGAPAFLIGSRVRGGAYGAPPDLTRLEEGDIPYATDFRSVYTTLEREWLRLQPSTKYDGLDLFHG